MKEAEKLNLTKSMELFEKAKAVVPGGVVGARHPRNFIEGEYPIFNPERAAGSGMLMGMNT